VLLNAVSRWLEDALTWETSPESLNVVQRSVFELTAGMDRQTDRRTEGM